MTRMIRDYLEIRATGSLDDLIEHLQAVRESLPAGAEPEVRLRGDDHFGRHIAIAYRRPLTAEEAAAEARHADDGPGLEVAA